MQTERPNNSHSGAVVPAAAALFCLASASFAQTGAPPLSPTNIFAPASTPADSIFGLSMFVLEVTAAIFVVVFSFAGLLCREIQEEE